MSVNIVASQRPQTLFKSASIYTLGDFLATAFSGFLLIPLFVHFMNPEQYGLFGTVIALINVLGTILCAGLISAVGRFYFIYVPKGKDKDYLGGTWLFQSALSVFISCLLLIFVKPIWRFLVPEIPLIPYGYFVIVGGVLAFGANFIFIWLRVQERPFQFIMIQLLGIVVYAIVVVILLVWQKLGATGAILAALSSSLVLAVVSILYMAPRLHWGWHWSLVRPTISFASWAVLGTVGYFLISKSQIFFLQKFHNLTAVGIYNLGQQLGSVIILLSVSFAKAWQPTIYQAMTPVEAGHAIARTSKYYVGVMLFLTLGISLFSDEILSLLARPTYREAGLILRLSVIAAFIYILSTLSHTALFYQKRASFAQIATIVGAGLNLLFNYLFVPIWGMTGAATAMIISFIFMTSLSFGFAHYVIPIRYPWRSIIWMIFITFGIITVEWFLVPHGTNLKATAIRMVLFITFPVLLLITKVFSSRDAVIIWNIAKNVANGFKYNS